MTACRDKAWTLRFWRRDGTGDVALGRFKCGSWRHAGKCAAGRLYKDYLRVREGVAGKENQAAYIVLTHDAGSASIDKYDHWRDLSSRWDRALKPRLQKGTRWGKFQYAQTWEATQKGKAHVNLAVVSPRIAEWCSVDGCRHVTYRECPNKNPWCRNCGGRGTKGKLCPGWSAQKKILEEAAVASGFGRIVWLAPVASAEKFASYLNKRTVSRPRADAIASEATSSAIKGQLPIDAPARFRRVRFSAKWPKPEEQVEKISDWTGELVQKPLEVVEAEMEAEKRRLDSSCARAEGILVLVDGVGSTEDARDAALPDLRAELVADGYFSRPDPRPPPG